MADTKYDKLVPTNDYDKPTVEQLAEAMNERRDLERRRSYLDQIISDNSDLSQFVWTTAEGDSKALHKVDDDHLKNIMNWIVTVNKRPVPKAIQAEALSRNIEVPVAPVTTYRDITTVGNMMKLVNEMTKGSGGYPYKQAFIGNVIDQENE